MIIGLVIFCSWLLLAVGALLIAMAMANGETQHDLVFKNDVSGTERAFSVNIVFVGLAFLLGGVLLNVWLWPGW